MAILDLPKLRFLDDLEPRDHAHRFRLQTSSWKAAAPCWPCFSETSQCSFIYKYVRRDRARAEARAVANSPRFHPLGDSARAQKKAQEERLGDAFTQGSGPL